MGVSLTRLEVLGSFRCSKVTKLFASVPYLSVLYLYHFGCLKVTELKKTPKIKGFCDQREVCTIYWGEKRCGMIKTMHLWHISGLVSWVHPCCGRQEDTDGMGTCPRCIFLIARREEPQAPVLSMLRLLSFCPRALSVRGESCLGPGQPPAAGSLLWVLGRRGMWGRVAAGRARLSAQSHCKILGGPRCMLAGDRHPRATSQLHTVSCSNTPWLEDVGLVARLFFRGTLIFIFQFSYLDENKSLTVCVSLQ